MSDISLKSSCKPDLSGYYCDQQITIGSLDCPKSELVFISGNPGEISLISFKVRTASTGTMIFRYKI